MGGVFSANGAAESRVLMIGLDAAGKTTVLYRLSRTFRAEVVTTIPTIGFNVETLERAPLEYTVWVRRPLFLPSPLISRTRKDVGGEDKIRPLWRHYYQNTRKLIFMVDSHDRCRFPEARKELECALREDELREVPLLVVANKQVRHMIFPYLFVLRAMQDLPNAVSVEELTEEMGLSEIEGRSWTI